MKAGETVTCPHCGEKTVVKLKKVMDGWQVSGEKLVCALCAGELGSPGKERGEASAARNRLAALLGGDDTVKVSLERNEEYGRGCRNCGHLLEHPFKLLCELTQKEVDPMYECPQFVIRCSKEK